MKLLVSVVNPEEAQTALAVGVDILDIKNPAEGSLGAPSPETVRRIRAVTPPHVPLSVAIGDMPNLPGTAALAAYGAARLGATYVKVGLWGVSTGAEGRTLLQAVRTACSDFPNVRVVACGYADAARLPHRPLAPLCLPAVARDAGVDGCMLDTGLKDGRRLWDFLSEADLRTFVEAAHAAGLFVALAGTLQAEDLLRVRDLGVDVVGVRSAACRDGHRTGPLDATRLRQLRALLSP
ncbi:MAG: (5-formylfuran-3-yl)methyl phosphate synthase [Acidobacteria bacterium]|nr:(5-formylfuran-3-yl)methyl phosphate synthase [Acidobacteriota bacterium]MDW7984000.1 (5-formylfuran-3-yl)methyl phosphate synthase [Acidobacteriota bacterium]